MEKLNLTKENQEKEVNELERAKANLVIDNCNLDEEMIQLRRENQHIEFQLKRCTVSSQMFG